MWEHKCFRLTVLAKVTLGFGSEGYKVTTAATGLPPIKMVFRAWASACTFPGDVGRKRTLSHLVHMGGGLYLLEETN